MAAGQILSIAYGIQIQEHNDPYVIDAEEASIAVSKTLNPGSYLVDLFPFRTFCGFHALPFMLTIWFK